MARLTGRQGDCPQDEPQHECAERSERRTQQDDGGSHEEYDDDEAELVMIEMGIVEKMLRESGGKARTGKLSVSAAEETERHERTSTSSTFTVVGGGTDGEEAHRSVDRSS